MPHSLRIGQRLLLTLWVGAMWAVGYLAVPILFQSLERPLAGEVAGRMFTAVNLIGLFCGAVLLAALIGAAQEGWRRSWRVWAVVAMLSLIVTAQFGLQPLMQELKTQGLASEAVAARFNQLHGVSSVLYSINSLLGLVLVAFGLNPARKEVE